MNHVRSRLFAGLLIAGSAGFVATFSALIGAEEPKSFEQIRKERLAVKPVAAAAHKKLMEERYDLAPRISKTVTMTRGKPVPVGPTAKLKEGFTFERLALMTPEDVRKADAFPYLPLPHPDHVEGGMLFPKFAIDEVKRQTGRDLERFDLDFDIPDAFLPEFPPAIFLTTRPDLGDVSQGKLITLDNFTEIFGKILNPKQLEGLRLLVTPFPQAQFNATDDRRSNKASLGVTCFDCHMNGHTNGATHLVGDTRPQAFRRRIDTPSLRGVNIQRLFGSQRALRSIEDFTEFEQRAAYFDGDPAAAAKKGVSPLERGSQVQAMAEFQELLDFPPAPKLNLFGRLDPAMASEAELRGEAIFAGKAKCAACHAAPFFTDNLMHDLRVDRFFEPREANGLMMTKQGMTKTFPLRGIKDSPPYLHDGRLLTLEDVVEFFNLILETKLTKEEKEDLVQFLETL